jgi:plastocyanin
MRDKFLLSIPVLLLLFAATTVTAGDVTGKITARGARDAGNAVVYIEKITGKTFTPPKEPLEMDQKDMTFIPHVLPILVGTTVAFLNSDPVLHNIFSPDAVADKMNLGSWPKGQTRNFTFKKPGVAALLCNVHPEMSAYVVVVETPYFAVSAKDGSYTIKNVPPGKYTLKIWHEKLKGKPVEVTVPETGAATADFLIAK